MIRENGQNATSGQQPAAARSSGPAVSSKWNRDALRDWSTWAVLLNGALLAIYLAWLPFREEQQSGATLVDQLATLLSTLALELQLVLAIVAWRASASATLSRGRKRGWRFFALACLVYWVGNLI